MRNGLADHRSPAVPQAASSHSRTKFRHRDCSTGSADTSAPFHKNPLPLWPQPHALENAAKSRIVGNAIEHGITQPRDNHGPLRKGLIEVVKGLI